MLGTPHSMEAFPNSRVNMLSMEYLFNIIYYLSNGLLTGDYFIITYKKIELSIKENLIMKENKENWVVKETLHLHPPAPLLILYKCDETVNILDFNVPKKCISVSQCMGHGKRFNNLGKSKYVHT